MRRSIISDYMKLKFNMLLLFFCPFIVLHIKAQNIILQPLGNIELEVSYQFTQLHDYPNEFRNEDWRGNYILMLEIGESKSHSYVVEEHKNMIASLQMFEDKNRWNLDVNIHALLGETYINYPQKGELTQLVNLDAAGVFVYTENIPDLKWEIKTERKTILGYECQRATCSFRGRYWEAWFSSDIPLPFGPWKLHNLPGLIMEASDAKNEYHFIATGIDSPKETKKMQIPTEHIRSIKRKDALRMESALHKDHGVFAEDYGITFWWEGLEHMARPYFPVELK